MHRASSRGDSGMGPSARDSGWDRRYPGNCVFQRAGKRASYRLIPPTVPFEDDQVIILRRRTWFSREFLISPRGSTRSFGPPVTVQDASRGRHLPDWRWPCTLPALMNPPWIGIEPPATARPDCPSISRYEIEVPPICQSGMPPKNVQRFFLTK